MIEKNFDIPFIADLALREKQIQQNYRPIIAVHKWFARRPGTLFRGLILSEFSPKPLDEAFYESNEFPGICIADPFMGGGTPLIEANRVGCDIIGFDINPMSYWIVKQELDYVNLKEYELAAKKLLASLEEEVGNLYQTICLVCGSKNARVKYFLWVKIKKCVSCGNQFDLFPGYLLSGNARHPKHVFICPECGELSEVDDRGNPGRCKSCSARLIENGPAKRNKCKCPHCGTNNTFSVAEQAPLHHRLFAIEYYCRHCKGKHVGRFFKKPDSNDFNILQQAEKKWRNLRPIFLPEDEIPRGDETDRLHRWGYKYYRDLFNFRQLLGLEVSAGFITKYPDEQIRNALATNFSDLLRYQNMLCRYDTMALKSLDIFSVHGFPVGLIQCESNLLGIMEPDKKVCVGSGGWTNIIEKYRKAKSYCERPFEVRHRGHKKEIVPIQGEWIGEKSNGSSGNKGRGISIACADAAKEDIPERFLDAVFTDPPYFGNVQYAELMDFCYVWLRKLIRDKSPAFTHPSTRNNAELTGNESMGRGLLHFAEGLSSVFQRMAKALKPGHPFVFTYHHNDIKAYYPVAVALLDSGLTCSASLPCPGEMGASIHINGTGSSIIDTVFVCRSTGVVPKRWLPREIKDLEALIESDIEKLNQGGVKPTLGDKKCIFFGHLIRLAVWHLRKEWNRKKKTETRLLVIENWINQFGDWEKILLYLNCPGYQNTRTSHIVVAENKAKYGEKDEVSF